MLDWKYRPKTNEELAAEDKEKAQAETTVEEKPEGFASKNVKSITFIIMVALFLVFLGPMSVFTIRDRIEERRDAKKPTITQDDVLDLSFYKSDLTIEQVMEFKGHESRDETKTSYIIFTDEFIFYVEQENDSPVVTDTYLRSRNKDKNTEIDIRTDNVINFFTSK